MIELTRINLLPYREQLEQKKKQQFKILMLAALAVGVGLSTLAYLGINQAISKQDTRNVFLEQEVKKLDIQLEEIGKLKEEKDNFISRKQKVEELQDKRFQAAKIIDTLNILVPEGTYLTSVSAKNPTAYDISGKATSDNKIAMFMRSIPSAGIFMQPELSNIKKVDNAQEFTLKVLLNQPKPMTTEDTGENSNGQ